MHQMHCQANPARTQYVPWTTGKKGMFSGRRHTEETIKKIAKAKMGNKNATHRGDRQSFYKDVRMDSRWETGVARYLDSISIIWKYSEKGYKLSDGRYYYPDFFIYKDGILEKLIEVKGYFRENNRKKFDLFLQDYPNIVIELWDKEKLQNLSIIDKSGYVIELGAVDH